MNAKQERLVERLRAAILLSDGLGTAHQHDYEYKRFDVDDTRLAKFDKVLLYTVVGRIGDEGTMAEAFGRVKRHTCIGPRGGLRLLNAKRQKGNRGFWAVVNRLTR